MRHATLALLLAGCFNAQNTPGEPLGPVTEGTTYRRDLQPLIAQHCQGCHTAGGISPFALDTFEDAQRHGGAMAAATQSRSMPPWMPDEQGCQPLKGSRRLTDAEVKLFQSWVEAGMPEGAPAQPMPVKQEKGLERVDVSLRLPAPYTPKANLTDDYRCFGLSHGQTVDRDIIGVNVKPGVRQMVHHVLIYAVDPVQAAASDAADPGVGWECFAGPGTNAKMIGGWVPGTSATQYPSGTGIPLLARETVVVQIHYNVLAAGAQTDDTSLELQLADGRVARPAEFTALANWWFNLPPMAMNQTVEASVRTPNAGTVWGVVPHMHTKGRAISVTKNDACLVNVKQWDFHWQQSFFFAAEDGLEFGAGETVKLSCTFDNPTSAPVTWGEKTSDEMCLVYFYVTR
ncbi:MAG: hypothetical protein JNK82_41705 [Myxococcaceae bacterium]|nr:hypothetical protein [Myxococcaceae bacterium]